MFKAIFDHIRPTAARMQYWKGQAKSQSEQVKGNDDA